MYRRQTAAGATPKYTEGMKDNNNFDNFSLHKGTWSIHMKRGLKRDGHVYLAVAIFLI